MKIVFLGFASYYTPGMAYQDNVFNSVLLDEGHEVTYLAANDLFINGEIVDVEPGTEILSDGLKLVRLPYRRFFNATLTKKARLFSNVESVLEREAPDIIYCHGVFYQPIWTAARYCRHHPQVRIYADTHASYANSATSWLSLHLLHSVYYRFLYKRLEPLLTQMFYVGLEEKHFFEEVYHPQEKLLSFLPLGGLCPTDEEYRDMRASAREELSLLEAMSMAESIPDVKKAAAAKLTAFMNMMVGLRMEALSLSVEGMIERTLRESGYLEYLKEEGEIEAEARRENLEELVNKAADLGGEIGLDALSQFLSETSLVADVDALEEDPNRVVLMTLHSAKGLEFPKVYMAGMEQQVFPGERVSFSGDDEDLEEERRLCYVGITRAMKKLVLTAAARRMTRGEFQTHFISQFIEEIPPEVLKHENRGLMRGRFNNYDTSSAGGGRGWHSEAVTGEGDSSQPFSPGDRVQNRRFGAGTVEKVEELGSQLSVTVLFDKFGRKVIMAGALTRANS